MRLESRRRRVLGHPARASLSAVFVMGSQQPKATAPSVEERVEIIADMMRTLRWERGVSNRMLAAQWGLARTTVDHAAAEASRRVRDELRDPESTANDLAAAMRKIVYDNIGLDGNSDFKRQAVAVKAAEALAKIVGALAPTKTENVNVDVDSAATPAKARALVREMFGNASGPADSTEHGDDSGAGEPGEGTPSE